MIASSQRKTYKALNTTYKDFQPYEAILLNDQGLIQQRNTTSGRLRRIRATPVGPDGEPHFEFREGGVGSNAWSAVSPACVKHLAAVAAGRGDAHYSLSYPNDHPRPDVRGSTQRYHARLEGDGFIVQRNVQTGLERPLRPAPWLGHGTAIETGRRVDSTEGFIPRRVREAPEERLPEEERRSAWCSKGRRAAHEFYVAEAVDMGEAERLVPLQETIPTAYPVGPIYYFMPTIDLSVPMATPV